MRRHRALAPRLPDLSVALNAFLKHYRLHIQTDRGFLPEFSALDPDMRPHHFVVATTRTGATLGLTSAGGVGVTPTGISVRCNYLTPKAEAVPLPGKGFGSVAREPIVRGEVLATFGGLLCDRATLFSLDDDRRHRSIQIDDDKFYAGPPIREPGDSINHSCSPNGGPRNSTQIIALRNISVGEELTFDYGTTDGGDYDEFDCACGTDSCRGTVSGNDWRRTDVRERHGAMFSPYLLRRMITARNGRELGKSDVETLITMYDIEPISALTSTLRIILARPHANFTELVAALPVSHATKMALRERDTSTLDELMKVLNEARGRDILARFAPITVD